MENVITLCKLIGLLFCHPSLLKTTKTRNDLARSVMGTIFLVNIKIVHLAPWLSGSTKEIAF